MISKLMQKKQISLKKVVKVLKDIIGPDFIVGGGSVFDFVHEHDYNDIDVFLGSLDNFDAAVDAILNYEGTELGNGRKFYTLYETANATTLSNSFVTIQIIKKCAGTPQKIMDHFDLSSCNLYMDSNGNVHYGEKYTGLSDIKINKLNSASIKRYFKYIAKGCQYDIPYLLSNVRKYISSDEPLIDFYTDEVISKDEFLSDFLRIMITRVHDRFFDCSKLYTSLMDALDFVCSEIKEPCPLLLTWIYHFEDIDSTYNRPESYLKLILQHKSEIPATFKKFQSTEDMLTVIDKYPELII